MFASIPTLIPQDAHIPWHASNALHATYASNQAASTGLQAPRQPAQRSQPNPPPSTLLNRLRADETLVEIRKAHVRRFGATWLKPPGVAKTLQGMWDEKAEREEQEAAQAREQALLDEQAAAVAEAEAQNARALAADDDSGAEERDLDDDIPEADDAPWLDDDGEDAMPTEEGDGDYAEDAATADAAGEPDAAVELEEHDLDDDVPEAGSYQDSDTDLEDLHESLSDEEADEDMREVRGQSPIAGNVTAAALGSSILGSSPVGQSSGARSRGYSGRVPGREN